MIPGVIGILGNRLQLETGGESVNEDALWLAAMVPPLPAGSRILEAGCGVGPCALALALRLPGCAVTGVEIDPALAQRARQNAARNSLTVEVVCRDFLTGVAGGGDDVVVCNPPFYLEEIHSTPTTEAGRRARSLPQGAVALWMEALCGALTPAGQLFMVVHTQWEAPLRAWQASQGGLLELWPLQTAPARPAKRLLVRWRAEGNGMKTHDPLPAYAPDLREQVLRQGKPLDVFL